MGFCSNLLLFSYRVLTISSSDESQGVRVATCDDISFMGASVTKQIVLQDGDGVVMNRVCQLSGFIRVGCRCRYGKREVCR